MSQQLFIPSDDLDEFERQMDKMLYAYFPQEHRSRPRTWRPPTDVYETDDAVIVKLEVAGMNPDDFKISFDDRVLTISGSRQDHEAKLSYHCLEIPYGDFRVQVFLPGTYTMEEIEARYANGFLYITLPKHNEEHRVPIRVRGG
jgi:HSP20 family protein